MVQALYYGLFVGLFVFFLQWESAEPRAPFDSPAQRWRHVGRNLLMLLLVVLVADVLVGDGLLQASRYLYQPPQIWLQAAVLPLTVQILLAFLLSDLLDYGMHVASHRIGWLWRLHAVHHTDPHLDVTTAARAHPLEISLHVAAKIGLYALLGLPLLIEGMRAILLNSLLCVQHANVNYPPLVERIRWLLVTPAMHRIHHHPTRPLIDRNFGFVFSFWDRLFGSYQTPEAVVTPGMGLAGHEGEKWQSIIGMLVSPLRIHPRSGTATGVSSAGNTAAFEFSAPRRHGNTFRCFNPRAGGPICGKTIEHFPMSQRHRPNEIKLHQKSRVLEVSFDDGARFMLPCEYLRVFSPSAEVRGHTADAWKLETGKEQVNIDNLEQVGGYAVKIYFNDGHKTGLYDWNYLYNLGRGRVELWALYLERLHNAGKQRNAVDPFEALADEA